MSQSQKNHVFSFSVCFSDRETAGGNSTDLEVCRPDKKPILPPCSVVTYWSHDFLFKNLWVGNEDERQQSRCSIIVTAIGRSGQDAGWNSDQE
jgi:hypothetical protein